VFPRAHPTWLIPAVSNTISTSGEVVPQLSVHSALAPQEKWGGVVNASATFGIRLWVSASAVQATPA
jgi:hypothetical protein